MQTDFVDLRLLHHFIIVAKHQSLTRASEELGVSKSKLSKDLSKLEQNLDTKLLERSSRMLRLTDTGNILLSRANTMLEDSALLIDAVQARADATAGQLRLAASPALGRVLSQSLIPDFLTQWPKVSVSLSLSYSFENLFQEGLDLAFRIGRNDDDALIEKRLGGSNRVLVASPDYVKQNQPISSIDDLRQHRILHFFATGSNEWTLDCDGQFRSVNLPAVFQCADFEALKHAVLTGGGIAMMPWFTVKEDIARGRLSMVLPQCKSPTLPIFAVYREGVHKANKLARFIEHIDANHSLFDLEYRP